MSSEKNEFRAGEYNCSKIAATAILKRGGKRQRSAKARNHSQKINDASNSDQ
jgi:hypothetical protein